MRTPPLLDSPASGSDISPREKTATTGGSLDILSCGMGLPDTDLPLLREAEHLFGSRALLACCSGLSAEKHIISAKAAQDAAEALRLVRSGRRVVALASGDALYHGFGGTIAALPETAGLPIRFHPGITAFQALFHRLGLVWNDARLFSAHWHMPPLREIAESPLAVVYGGSRFPAHLLAGLTAAFHPSFAKRRGVLAERLGGPEERIIHGTLEELATVTTGPTSILLLLPTELPAPVLGLGLPEETYQKENNLITASDVRAVILARLRLPAWGVLWDLGAGSGSVGLEAATLRPRLHVFGVERKPERCAMIEANKRTLGITNYTLHAGELPEILAFLPSPDRIFVGGGGNALAAVLSAAHAALRPGGLLLASSVTLESFRTLMEWTPECRTGLCSLDIANEQPLAGDHRHLKAQNRIHLFTFAKANLP